MYNSESIENVGECLLPVGFEELHITLLRQFLVL
jgi:hypothetical protein